MARRTHVTLVDDLDGSDATQTLAFGFQGAQYEIDLNDEHAEELTVLMGDWIKAARRTGGRRIAGAGRKGASDGPKVNAQVREWARENGMEVSERGRISHEVRRAWEDATGGA